ncbi:MAG: hypothetical protein ISP90_02865 [Nevskia sp.]|nr:hypothetical protein [Nevskia sp.]
MCFSAQAWVAWQRYVREFGAHLAFQDFVRLYGHRSADPRIKIPKAMDAAFSHPRTDEERQIWPHFDGFNTSYQISAKAVSAIEGQGAI